MFPEIPEIKSIAAPILVSPIMGSYERVCIGAVSVIDGDVEVSVIGLPESIAKMSYQISMVAVQLRNYLEEGKSLSDFEPMLSDFFVGPEQYGNFGTHERAIRTILRNHSFLWKGE